MELTPARYENGGEGKAMEQAADVDKRVAEFLIQSRIAVAGVSRSGSNPGNSILRRLGDCGVEVYAVNPNAQEIGGVKCYPSLSSVPVRLDGVVITTSPENTEKIVRECVELEIPRVWMHRSVGTGSISEEAVKICRENNIQVIKGGCPMMFCPPVDIFHRCLGWIARRTGKMQAT